LYRYEMIEIACDLLAIDGVIVCDNAEGYGFQDGFKERGLNRVDFYGNAPGVVHPHCTSLYFNPSSFVFDPAFPIVVDQVSNTVERRPEAKLNSGGSESAPTLQE
jgi:hypothetical protein